MRSPILLGQYGPVHDRGQVWDERDGVADDHVDPDVRRWAASGGMFLTGPSDGPGLGPPERLIPLLDHLAARIAAASGALGHAVSIDPIAVISARAASLGLTRRGALSCGGASRLLPTADGWVALTLARADDVELVPALTGRPYGPEPWRAVERFCAEHRSDEVVERAVLLGLAVGAWTPDDPAATPSSAATGFATEQSGPPARSRPVEATVVDLSALWAGPLCTRILADAGCRVLKVESIHRPDGARQGTTELFDQLHHGKANVALDFSTTSGRQQLADLVARADVVVEGSRPRALRQLGIDVFDMVTRGPQLWTSITGHGWTAAPDRIGFGDDAAIAGGLVVTDGDRPYFCADAIADPLTGLMAAAHTLESLAVGGRWHVDVALSAVAALGAGPTRAVPDGIEASPPARLAAGPAAAPLGADTARVLQRRGGA
ncbi:MAG: CoA transferase [Acidimicrobiales bacterium]